MLLKRKEIAMRVPQIGNLGFFCMTKYKKNVSSQKILKNQNDTLSFSSNAKYLKKYSTLPDEIKNILSPKDAIDMFKDMEYVAQGKIKRDDIGRGTDSRVYDSPWLDDYCFIILSGKNDNDTKVVYSTYTLGDAVWSDKDDSHIQILKKAS